MEYPFLTVAMPVRNEERFIGDTLRQLLKQDYPADRYEVIVADGESTDKTVEIVKNISREYPQVKLMSNPGRLPSSGRNVGFRNGKGKYFLVIDGHCLIPDTNLFKNVVELFRRADVDCLGRPQPFITPEDPTWQRAIALARASNLGHSGESYIHSTKEGYVSPVSMGCAYSRKIFETIGYVDEDFDAAEDVEFNYRVEKAGFKTFFSPKIAVIYFPREDLKGLWKQLNRYGYGRAKFTFKHPETFNVEILLPVIFVLGLLFGPFSLLIHHYIFALYVLSVFGYLLLLAFFSVRIRSSEPISFVIKLFVVFLTIHFGIGIGLLRGFIKEIRRKLFKKR